MSYSHPVLSGRCGPRSAAAAAHDAAFELDPFHMHVDVLDHRELPIGRYGEVRVEGIDPLALGLAMAANTKRHHTKIASLSPQQQPTRRITRTFTVGATPHHAKSPCAGLSNSKKADFAKPNALAMRLLGKLSISVFCSRTLPL
jgi:hypothetical protein